MRKGDGVTTAFPSAGRRQFLVTSGSGLLLALLPRLTKADTQGTALAAVFAQPFLRIGDDSTVTVIAKHLDMGQGIWSGLASIIAEELDARHDQICVEGAPADKAVYKNLIFGFQSTGGSTSIANSFEQLKQAGAIARCLLIAAASARWNVASSTITISQGVIFDQQGRRATFGELASSAALQPVPDQVVQKEPSQYIYLGKSWPRIDQKEKSSGKTLYGIDLQRPGMMIAVVARSPRFGGKVSSFDAAAALKLPGVREVVQVPSGIAVLADKTFTAIKARRLLVVNWDDKDAEQRSTPQLIEDFRAQAGGPTALIATNRGDCDTAFAAGRQTLSAEYVQPYLAHAPMEPLAALCELRDGRCDIWGGIQNQTGDQSAAAKILGLPIERVFLHTIYAGGSFGRRATVHSDWIGELAEIVKATGGKYPVKVFRTREDDITGGYYRPMSIHRVSAALNDVGDISAFRESIVAQSFFFEAKNPASAGKVDPFSVDGNAAVRYDIPNAKVDWVNATSPITVQMFRALSFNHTTFVKEVFMDELARLAERDPLEYRLAHLASYPRQTAVLRFAADKAGWGQSLPEGSALGLAIQDSQGTVVAQIVQLRIVEGKILIDRVVCVVDCGFALNPDIVKTQMEGGIGFGLSIALYGNVSLANGLVEQSNFHNYPVLRMAEMPRRIDTYIIPSNGKPTGVGEPGSVPIIAAVCNAVATLTKRTIRRLPISLEI